MTLQEVFKYGLPMLVTLLIAAAHGITRACRNVINGKFHSSVFCKVKNAWLYEWLLSEETEGSTTIFTNAWRFMDFLQWFLPLAWGVFALAYLWEWPLVFAYLWMFIVSKWWFKRSLLIK